MVPRYGVGKQLRYHSVMRPREVAHHLSAGSGVIYSLPSVEPPLETFGVFPEIVKQTCNVGGRRHPKLGAA